MSNEIQYNYAQLKFNKVHPLFVPLFVPPTSTNLISTSFKVFKYRVSQKPLTYVYNVYIT